MFRHTLGDNWMNICVLWMHAHIVLFESKGKSSLLSMLSMIELPSSDELTTRCPIMLKMNRSPTKSATITVIWKDLPPGKSEKDVAFSPVTVNNQNWTNLTSTIASAQAHIVKHSGKEVARDVVNVKISSPSCEDLTLIDLPGIVRAVGKGEKESLAGDIQSLMEEYLKNPRCVILAVHPCNVDFHNSQIMAEARKVDPETKRTIPVLTKPDLIDQGAEGSVKDLLLGLKTKAFEKGFHMIKGRSQMSLSRNETIEAGLEKEEAFFRNTCPWKEITNKMLLGTKNLRIKLSDLLMQLIHDTFPDIIAEMKEKKKNATEKLDSLGEIPITPEGKRQAFFKCKDTFVSSLRPLLCGGHLEDFSETFGQNNEAGSNTSGASRMSCSAKFHLHCKDYKNILQASKLSNVASGVVGDEVIVSAGNAAKRKEKIVLVREDFVFLENYFGKHRSFVFGEIREQGSVFDIEGEPHIATSQHTVCKLEPVPRADVRCDSTWILHLIEKYRPLTLPVFVHGELFESIVRDLIKNEWEDPSHALVDAVSATVRETVKAFVTSGDGFRRFPKLLQFLLRKIDSVINQLTDETRKRVAHFIDTERIPYSQNDNLFENVAKMRHKELLDETISAIGPTNNANDQMLKSSVLNIVRNVFERNQNKSVDEHMAQEMLHVLEAHGKVALGRFCDDIPMFCSQGILCSFESKLNEALSGVRDDEVEKLLTAPPGEIEERERLKRELKSLEAGLGFLEGYY